MADLFTVALVFSTIRLSTPLILAALGGLFSERAGVINIALEGMMLAGAFTAAAMTYATGSPWAGLLAAIGAGALVAAIHAVACIRYRADQVVVGTAINILMIGLPGFLSGAFFLSSGSTPQLPIDRLVPTAPIVLAFAFVPLAWYVLYRTPFGLRLRAVGENPEAAQACGISVRRIHLLTFALGSALAGISGALITPATYAMPAMGFNYTLYAFSVVIIGGLGSTWGAVLAGFLLGIAESISVIWLPSGYNAIVGPVLMLVVLILRPQGLLGRITARA